MATELPASGYLENASRNNAEMKVGIAVVRDVVSNMLGGDGSYELTIASGAVTPPARDHGGFFRIDTEGGAGTDALDTITLTNLPDGAIFRVRAEDAARVVTLTHAAGGSGQMLLKDGVNFVFASENSWVEFQVQSTDCVELQRYVPPGDLASVTALTSSDLVRVYDASATTEKSTPATQLGHIVQEVEATPYTTRTDISTVIPTDDTIPQNTEGFQICSVTITPKSASNRLVIEAEGIYGTIANAGTACAALFQDSTANALAIGASGGAAGAMTNPTVRHEMAAGTTSSTTFYLRVGPSAAAANLYINGNSSGRLFGGIGAARLRVREYAA